MNTKTFFTEENIRNIGYVTAISSNEIQATLFAKSDMNLSNGSFVIMQSGMRTHLGLISKIDLLNNQDFLARISLKGEITKSTNGKIKFKRGMSSHVLIRAEIIPATEDDLLALFGEAGEDSITIGRISGTKAVPANLSVDKLLCGNFGIFGNRGSGKSTLVSLLLHKIFENSPFGHCILFDPHGEYEAAFNGSVNIIDQDNFVLPYWLLNSEEANQIFLDQQSLTWDVEQEVLNELIVTARTRFANDIGAENNRITADSPVPYRIGDLIDILDERLGSLGESIKVSTLRRMRQKILSVRADARYKFLFPKMGHSKDLRDILTDLLRIPVNGQPMTLVNTSGMLIEVAQVAVSTVSRLVFDFMQWSRDVKAPTLLMLDEANRYLGNSSGRFSKRTQSLWEQIAMEGRKFGLSIGIIAQIPSNLSINLISQMGTVMVKKMAGAEEISFLSRYLNDISSDAAESFAFLSPNEVYIAGSAISQSMTVQCEPLSESKQPRNHSVSFDQNWKHDITDMTKVNEGLQRWCDYRPMDL